MSGTADHDRRNTAEGGVPNCRGVEFGLVRSAYHPDAVDHHTGFS